MTLTSKIAAVNKMLRGAGFRHTASLSGSLPREVDIAATLLDEQIIEVMLKGWKQNTEKEVKYSPSAVDGTITVGTDILHIDASETHSSSRGLDVVHRGQKLYEAKKGTYVFTKDVYCDVIKNLEWTEITEPLKRYITIKAARVFVDTMNADQGTRTYKEQDEKEALRDARRLDNKQKDTRIRGLPAVDHRTSVLGPGRIRH